MNNKLLIIGLTWPEPQATAAGSRMLQLIAYFIKCGYEVTFASAASKSKLSFDFSDMAVSCIDIVLNSDTFNDQLKELKPGIVLFDRFIAEEQYGWRVKEVCPEAALILDTEDLHFLRKARELALNKGNQNWKNFIQNEITLREIASIYRCDLSLIISSSEFTLLREYFNIPPSILFYLPLFPEDWDFYNKEVLPNFDQREHFMSIGNFKHKPNADATRYLYKKIWPLIKKELPQAEIHVYGAYGNEAIDQMHNEKIGFLIKGWIADKQAAFIHSKVCLAPLRFGAGQKGKLLDAMFFGTPSVTTSIGAEGMKEANEWNGFIEDTPERFAEKAVKLYKEKSVWEKAQANGHYIINNLFKLSNFQSELTEKIQQITLELDQHRASNFIGKMLSHHSMKSTMYLSKWISLKSLPNDKIVD